MLSIPAAWLNTLFEASSWKSTSFLLGFGIHICLFRKGEWDLAARSVCRMYGLAFVLMSVFLVSISKDILVTFSEAVVLFAVHFIGLTTSICAYRYFFHRLRNFPGPSFASLSSWYTLKFAIWNQHQSEVIEGLHQKYGDFVRIGPNKLSIIDPAAITAIYARGSMAYKGPFYNINYPRENLDMCRTRGEHARRRKHWDRGLSTDELRAYVPTIMKHTNRLTSQIQTHLGQSVNAALWLDLFGFDVMFDLGFSKDMQRLNHGEEDFYIACAHQTLKLIGFFMHAPWMMHFFSWVPTLGPRFRKFRAHSKNLVSERLNHPRESRDVFSHIEQSYYELPRKLPKDIDNLAGDADLLVLAGSDSIAVATSNVLYQLALNPQEQEKLRDELLGIKDGQDLQVHGHAHLDAVINESMRLNPTAPAGHERMTPPQGLQIGPTYIPGNVTVFVSNYTTCREARFFEQPHRFIAERWTTRRELNKDPSVFIPFQTGTYACPGRNLAFMEMRSIIISIVSKYTVKPASPSSIKAEYLDKRDDRWLLGVGKLNLVFQEV